MTGRTAGFPSTATTRSETAPTARTAACGGVMIAVNASTLYMPRLLIVNVPPERSAGSKAAGAGAFGHGGALRGDFCKSRLVGVLNYGSDDAIGDGDGQADVDARIQAHGFVGPTGVHRRMALEDAGDQADQAVSYRRRSRW